MNNENQSYQEIEEALSAYCEPRDWSYQRAANKFGEAVYGLWGALEDLDQAQGRLEDIPVPSGGRAQPIQAALDWIAQAFNHPLQPLLGTNFGPKKHNASSPD